MHASRTLTADPRSAREARRFVGSTLAGWSLEALADAVTLLVNELVTNAVLHARSDMELLLLLSEEQLRVEVHDHSAAAPQRRHYSTESGTGRGLQLVESLATDWGVDRDDDGKSVWFVVPTGDQHGDATGFADWDLDAVEPL